VPPVNTKEEKDTLLGDTQKVIGVIVGRDMELIVSVADVLINHLIIKVLYGNSKQSISCHTYTIK